MDDLPLPEVSPKDRPGDAGEEHGVADRAVGELGGIDERKATAFAVDQTGDAVEQSNSLASESGG